MEYDDQSAPPLRIPDRIFALGHEPVGVRVTPYHKPNGIKVILNALDPEEIDTIRSSPFGKLVELAEKPSFSGRFGRFIISRQLKVENKHEAWFIFAGKPVRFSLREFAYVTGLNCGKFPKEGKKRSKKFLSEKPYWGDLFGTLKEVPVTSVVRWLKKRTVKDRAMRVKYALLALLAAVVLPTTHTPRISQVHAEKIRNIDEFLAFPWGRVSFDMLISSIKERNEVSLAQNTIGLKGFVLSIQLVMVEAIPALTEVVNDGSSSNSDDDGGDDIEQTEEDKARIRGICPGHARDTDAAGKVAVRSVIVDDDELFKASPDLCWSDGEEDPIANNLITLLEQGYTFNNSSFQGGVTMAEVNRMREQEKAEAITRKTVRPKQTKNRTTSEVFDAESIAFLVADKVKQDLSRVENQITTLSANFLAFQTTVKDTFQQLIRLVDISSTTIPARPTPEAVNPSNRGGDTYMADIRRPSSQHIGTQTEAANDDIIAEAIKFANQKTSLPVDGLNKYQGNQEFEPTEDPTRFDTPEGVVRNHTTSFVANQTTSEEEGNTGDEMNQAMVQNKGDISTRSNEEVLTDAQADDIQLSKDHADAAAADLTNEEMETDDSTDATLLRNKGPELSLDQIISPLEVQTSCIDGHNIVPDSMDASNPTISLVDDIIVDEDVEAADTSLNPLDKDLDPALLFPKPTFSLGLTQEERHQQKETIPADIPADLADKDTGEKEDQLVVCRKSKRLKGLPKSLVGEYQCDKRLLNRARVAFVDPNNIGGNIDYSAKFSSLLDKLKSPL